MRNTKSIHAAIALILIGVAFAWFMATTPSRTRSQEVLGSLKSISTTPDGTTLTLFSDVIVFTTIEALTRNSESVVVGTVIRPESSRNTARDPLDPSKEASDRVTMSQEYAFKVGEWIKGTGGSEIRIVYPQYTIMKDGSRFEIPYPALKTGSRYVLFVREGIPGTRSPVAEPWQFLLSNGQSKAMTLLEGGAPEAMMNLSEVNLLGQARRAAK